MVEIFKTAGIDYRHGPEKGVGFQCFSEVLSASEATMVKNERCHSTLCCSWQNPAALIQSDFVILTLSASQALYKIC